jgi:hypothetical protein
MSYPITVGSGANIGKFSGLSSTKLSSEPHFKITQIVVDYPSIDPYQ